MVQIILIEDNDELRNLLKINLKTYLGVDVRIKKNAADTIKFLNIFQKFSLIIATTRISHENTAKILISYVRKRPHLSLILLGYLASETEIKKSDEKNIVNIREIANWEKIIRLSGEILGIDTLSLNQDVPQDYIPIPIYYFYELTKIPCDVFIRIKKDTIEDHYIKKFHTNGIINKKDIQNYEEQNLKEFYVLKKMEKYFSAFISNQFMEKIKDRKLSEQERLVVMSKSYDIVAKKIVDLVIDEFVIKMINSIISTMVQSIENNSHINVLLFNIVNSPIGFIYQHAYMTCAVASACVRETSISKDHKVFQKIAFASCFQNISLSQDENLAKIFNLDDLEERKLNEDSKNLVLHHALESYNLIRNYEQIPLGADTLIKQHHGSLSGVGFLTSDVENFSILSRIFLISSDFVHYFLTYKEKSRAQGGKLLPIMSVLQKKYFSPKAKSTFNLLDRTFMKRERVRGQRYE